MKGSTTVDERNSSFSLALALLPLLKKKNSWGVGQAWGYRRRAFAAMARALGGGPGAKMHAEVMGREPEGASRAYEWPGWKNEEEGKN